MKKIKVISPKNLPQRLPVNGTLIMYFLLDYYHAPQWLWGAMGLLYLLGWIAAIASIYYQDKVDIFK